MASLFFVLLACGTSAGHLNGPDIDRVELIDAYVATCTDESGREGAVVLAASDCWDGGDACAVLDQYLQDPANCRASFAASQDGWAATAFLDADGHATSLTVATCDDAGAVTRPADVSMQMGDFEATVLVEKVDYDDSVRGRVSAIVCD